MALKAQEEWSGVYTQPDKTHHEDLMPGCRETCYNGKQLFCLYGCSHVTTVTFVDYTFGNIVIKGVYGHFSLP